MQTSHARRQRHRRQGAARRRGGGRGAASAIVVALPLLVFSLLLLVGFVGFTGAVAAYSYFSRDLPDPKDALDALSFSQQSVVYDRTGNVQLAKLGDDRREIAMFEEFPLELVDATTAIEDRTFWDNSGFDPIGFTAAAFDTLSGNERGGSTITQQLVRARLLPSSAFEGSIYERKIKEIIQSVRLTQAYPGEDGKRTIMEKYLNNSFYGNRSYGVKAAARSYFGKELDELTLAQMAILAAIPQSPTAYDLVRNAVEQEYTDADGNPATRLVVPRTAEIVQRRNRILEFMKDAERSVLSSGLHDLADYETAKLEPVILAPQLPERWRAPHFVWQVREQLAAIVCGDVPPDTCEKIDNGGYRVITSLDYDMQRVVEKWVLVAARAPQSSNIESILDSRKIPARHRQWIRGLIGRNIQNAASAVIDYRTGEVLAYAGSASYTGRGTELFQPQFDVLEDGWRQPGSAIKPIDYVIGIDDRTMTAATMFIDAVTNFAPEGREPYTPTQADGLERGPVRLRQALQFSLNIPAIKAGFINGLEHQLDRTRDFGLRYAANTIPVISESIGTIETHPIDLLSAYGAIANAGTLMGRQYILEIRDADGRVVWSAEQSPPRGKRVASPEAAYIVTDILAGNTIDSVNPYWADWAIYDGDTRRPAAYKTGTTSDNRDVHAYGYLAPPEDPDAPALAVGVWMGNSNNEPNKGSLSLDSSAPLWSAILTELSAGMPIADFADSRPEGVVEATVDAFTGMKPGGATVRTVKELFLPGTVPQETADLYAILDVDEASGLRWQEGCAGPMTTRAFLDFSTAEPAFPEWQPYTLDWARRAAAGRRTGGPEGTRPTYFYNNSFAPFGRTWGGRFAPTELCPIVAPPPPPPCIEIDPLFPVCPSLEPFPPEVPVPGDDGGNGGGGNGNGGGGGNGNGNGGGRPGGGGGG